MFLYVSNTTQNCMGNFGPAELTTFQICGGASIAEISSHAIDIICDATISSSWKSPALNGALLDNWIDLCQTR